MKLTSAARLRLVTVSVVAVLTFGIGFLSTLGNFRSEVGRLDRSINGISLVVTANPDAALSAALFQMENESLDVMMVLHSHDGNNTLVRDTSGHLSDFISQQDINFSVQPMAKEGKSNQKYYRYAVMPITDGELLFVAMDASSAHRSLTTNIRYTIFATVIAVLLASIIFSYYIRRVRDRDDVAALARMQEFLGDASHELRTPLTVIKGYVEMLSKGQIQVELDRERAFNRVRSEIQRMEFLIHDLLLLAELGESADRGFENVDVSEIVNAHTSDFETLNPQRSIDIHLEPNISIFGNYDYVSRFIQNALTNISRHTPIDAPVKVSLASKGKKLHLVIEDGGPGLPESQYGTRVHVFNRFDKSRSRENGGSGLGMSIMSGIVEKLGGTLSLKRSSLGGLALEAELPMIPR